MRQLSIALLMAATLSACSSSSADSGQAAAGPPVTLRTLADSGYATVPQSRDFALKGQKVATPSDPRSDHYVLRVRTAVTGNVIAMLREERGARVAYARTETDCSTGRMHILGVGSTRGEAEVAHVEDGPLRPMKGLPLRQELARAICERSGTPLTVA